MVDDSYGVVAMGQALGRVDVGVAVVEELSVAVVEELSVAPRVGFRDAVFFSLK